VSSLAAALDRARALDDAALAELGLPSRQYGLLALLEHGPVARQHELGAVLGLDRTTTAKLMRRLADRGLVRRAPLPGNSRALLVELTPAGDALRAEAARKLRACDDELLAPLDPAERDRLRTSLDRLVAGTRSPEGAR
jgi:DNA-binding MarR family transcriptional regulator